MTRKNLKQAKQRSSLSKINKGKEVVNGIISIHKNKWIINYTTKSKVLIIQKVYGQLINNDQKIILKNIDLKNYKDIVLEPLKD